jgi:hypothetical protein
MKWCRRILCLVGVALVVAPHAWSYQERTILSMTSGRCSLGVEADDQSRVLRLRVYPEGEACHIERELMLSALRAASLKTDEPKLGGKYSSLYIGRLVNYPWLSRDLAETAYGDPAWSNRRGGPLKLDINKYVSSILFQNRITADIGAALGGNYRAISVSVEKVLVGTFRHVPGYKGELRSGKVPFDAQVWFRLERN